DPDRRVLGLESHCLPVELEALAERAFPSLLLGLAEGLGPRAVHAGQRVPAPALEHANRLLKLEPLRVLLQGVLEAVEGALGPVLLEVAEAELKDGVLVVGLDLAGPLEGLDGARQLPLLAVDRAEKHERRGDRRDRDGLRQSLLGLVPAPRVGE